MLLSLEQIEPRDLARVGGKALGLSRLAKTGLPVPAAVVIPSEIFRDFLQENGLWTRAEQGDPSLHEDIPRGVLKPMLVDALRAAATRLGPQLAVRSSGVDEDGVQNSFAGQYATCLGVKPGEDVERAVLRCWASAYAPQTMAYRCGPPEPGGMGVIIQQLVNARCAGVMFTINPLNGSWREMTVEAVWGLGEPMVSGQMIPDFYRVQRPRRTPRPVQRLLARARLSMLEEQIHPQQQQLSLGEGGLRENPVAAAQVGAPKLRLAELFKLCRLGLRAEGRLGGPQDVEWAQDASGRLYVLQARPVTTARAVRRSGPVVWTRRFVGERWTSPATPLGWSLMRELLDWFIAYPETSRRYLGGEEASRLYRFAPYFNVTVFRHLAFKAPGAPPPRFMLEMLPPDEEHRWLRRHAQTPDLRVYRHILATTIREQRWKRFRWNLFRNWAAWDAYREQLDQHLPKLQTPITSQQQALQRVEDCRTLARDYIKVHICSLLFANIWYQVSESVLTRTGHSQIISSLLQPPEASMTLRTNRALWMLGNSRMSLSDFLDAYGHRAANSWELFSPRWVEEPHLALQLAQTAALGPDPQIAAKTRSEQAEVALSSLPRTLRPLLRLTRRYLLLREDQRFHFDRLLWVWKQAYLWLENDTGMALRFLESVEVVSLLRGELSTAVAAERIQQRQSGWQAECERWLQGDEPPTFLVGDEAGDDHCAGDRLQGLGISSGVVTGPVRVLRSLADAGRFQPGEILVTQATDPGWTPLFLNAVGLVMERGGMLSHGAVVAREYQLPAVVNVPGVTRVLTDGQIVTVDGNRGVVWVR